MQTIQALSTARYGIGAKFVVCNNHSYRILKYNLRHIGGVSTCLRIDRFPESFGWIGRRCARQIG